MHVEAVGNRADDLRRDRPDETIFRTTIGNSDDHSRFAEDQEIQASTSGQEAARKQRGAWSEAIETDGSLTPFSTMVEFLEGRDVHWISIDIECVAASALDRWLPSRMRPWIIVLDGTTPSSLDIAGETLGARLVDLGYKPAYFDGTSAFFVTELHPELIQSFGLSINLFDNFESNAPYASGQWHGLAAQKRPNEDKQTPEHFTRLLEQRDDQIHELEEAVWDASSRENAFRQQLDQMRNSISWRATGPFRAGVQKLMAIKKLPSRIVSIVLKRLLRWLSTKPKLKDASLRWAQRFPLLKGRLAAIARAQGYGAPTLEFLDDDQEGEWYIDAPRTAVIRWDMLLQGSSKSK